MEEKKINSVSYTLREMELPTQGFGRSNIRLYYNRLEPRHREKLPHSHLAVEIDIFGDGCQGIYVIGEKTYEIHAGDIFILRSNEEHSIIHLEEGSPCICTGLQFSPDFIWSPNNGLGDMSYLYELFLGNSRSFCHKLPVEQESTRRIREQLQDIVEEFHSQPQEYDMMVRVKLISVLILVAREFQQENGESAELHIGREKRLLVEKALNYMDSHLSEPITLKEIAENVHMSPSYLSQLFKTLNGFSMWEYMVAKRLEQAKKLLLESEERILDISLKCGFNTITNFNRAFKRDCGMSPKEYRKKLQGTTGKAGE